MPQNRQTAFNTAIVTDISASLDCLDISLHQRDGTGNNSMNLDRIFAAWEHDRRAEAAQAQVAFQQRMNAIDAEIKGNLEVMKAKRRGLEGELMRVTAHKDRASANTQRIRAQRFQKPAPRTPLSDEDSLALARARVEAREARPRLHLARKRDPRQTSSQLLEWMSTGRQPRALKMAAATIVRQR